MSLGTRGGNIVEVQFANGDSTLCMIPSKFKKRFWIRKGGLLIVEQPVHDDAAKVTGTVVAVLYSADIKRLKKQGVDIPTFPDSGEGGDTEAAGVGNNGIGKAGSDTGSDASIPENTNRRPVVTYDDLSESESDQFRAVSYGEVGLCIVLFARILPMLQVR
eukprot:TRINITY_DN5845_c1_g1_i3.p1 TRINITY_DN5845_c1_g1~~TRINITY_DN5845_c1_g1_i3.p1  ORF type:complete len:161 (-),score=20.55 TRINITY_DN5845_c1_g1_i3:361-843(-)